MSYTPQPRRADHEKVRQYKYRFKGYDESKLKKVAEETGKCYCPDIGKNLQSFWLEMIPPPEAAAEGTVGVNEQEGTFPLPLYLYHTVNPYLNKMEAYTTEAEDDYNMTVIAPEWYYDAVEKLADVNLANQYILWVLTYYDKYITDEVSRKFWQKRFPWIMNERRKHYYIVKKVRDRIFDIKNEGIMTQEDLIFIYFVIRYLAKYIYGNLQDDDMLFLGKVAQKGSLKDTNFSNFLPKIQVTSAKNRALSANLNLYDMTPMDKVKGSRSGKYSFLESVLR